MEDDVDDEVEETGLLGVTGVEGGVGVFGRKNDAKLQRYHSWLRSIFELV